MQLAVITDYTRMQQALIDTAGRGAMVTMRDLRTGIAGAITQHTCITNAYEAALAALPDHAWVVMYDAITDDYMMEAAGEYVGSRAWIEPAVAYMSALYTARVARA